MKAMTSYICGGRQGAKDTWIYYLTLLLNIFIMFNNELRLITVIVHSFMPTTILHEQISLIRQRYQRVHCTDP